MKKLTFLVAALCACTMSFATTFEKVTAEPADWSGEYLLVYEKSTSEAYVWNGLDEASNYTTAAITDDAIDVTNPVTIKIAVMAGGYSVLVNGSTNDGKYISGTSNSNKLNFKATATANTLAYSDGHVVMTSGEIMVFNTVSGQTRFRYYKSSTITGGTTTYFYPQLYKKVVGPEVAATGIKLSETSLSKEQYKRATLVATLEPADATTEVVWSSSDEKVATVVNGVVTMVGVGNATITAQAGEGVKATCTVEVSEATVLTCAQAAEKALAVSANNEVAADGKYVIRGYVIKEAGKGIATDFESYGNYSFWMADDKSATEGTFEAFQVKPKDGKTLVEVGDYVEIVGDLTKFKTTAETVGKGNATAEIITKGSTTAIESVEMSNIYAHSGRIYGAEQGRIYTINGMDVTEQNGQLSNGIYIVKVGATATKIAVK
ncbi:MAG: Ig-like domain-containing protein [Paludibacteraceae bacterium]|nr:Ig-like domain-containing protein [Paludibacteraceae bacterium]